MANTIKYYSWVDVHTELQNFFNKEDQIFWLSNISFRVYWDGINITFSKPKTIKEINEKLKEIFALRLIEENESSIIELENNNKLPIFFEETENPDEIEKIILKPSLGLEPVIAQKENIATPPTPFENCTFFAFHSYKGGVGRTLHAMALALHLSEKTKVLLIDADFEAPGITWLLDNPQIAFSDFLALIHGSSQEKYSDIIAETSHLISQSSKENGNLYFLPAFRNIREDTPILEIKPEQIFKFSSTPFILTDLIKMLADKLEAKAVILDLRAGVSELSSGWFFDPRINKVFVTTLSSQSILGTAMMFRLLSRFDQKITIKDEQSSNPYIIISQVPKSSLNDIENSWADTYLDPNGILFPLRKAYVEAFINLPEYQKIESRAYEGLSDEQIIGRILSPLTLFSIEYDTLKYLPDNWDSVSKLIRQNNLNKEIAKIAKIESSLSIATNENFNQSRKKLAETTKNLVFAEKTEVKDFLVTNSIRSLANSFRTQLPVAVVVGAKGAGKTFLFKQIVQLANWKNFGQQALINETFNSDGITLPVTIPKNLSGLDDFINIPDNIKRVFNENSIQNIYSDHIKSDIEISCQENFTQSQWREKWFDYIAWAAGHKVGVNNVGREFFDKIKQNKIKIVAIFDGLEDLFQQFNVNNNEQRALQALLQDVTFWLESQPEKFLGIIVFIRKDLVTASISQNSGQFLSKYEGYELKWNVEEALRLVHWVLNKFTIFNTPTYPDWESTLSEKNEAELVQALYKLWGMRMAKDTSKEAYSHSWIIGSLANLKKEVQSRDIIRFLNFAAEKSIVIDDEKIIKLYSDRLLFPSAIRDSIQEVGKEKIEEVKKENEPLKKILEIIETKTQSLEFPCEPEMFRTILPDEKQIQILLDNGVITLYNGEYYMAEIYRKGMNFKYSRKGKPKVLYF